MKQEKCRFCHDEVGKEWNRVVITEYDKGVVEGTVNSTPSDEYVVHATCWQKEMKKVGKR